MRRLRLALGSVLVILLLSGCGAATRDSAAPASKRPSEADWRAGVEKIIGHPFRNDSAWDSYKSLYRGTDGWCSQSADQLALSLAVGVDSHESVANQERQLKLACPERSKVIDSAVKNVQDTTSKAERICGSDPNLLSADDLDYYHAVC